MPGPLNEKPRIGPWLRHYAEQERTSPRERTQEILLAGAAVVGFLLVLVGVLLAFLRFPLVTLGALVALWGIGLATLFVKRRRADAREREMRDRAGGRDRAGE